MSDVPEAMAALSEQRSRFDLVVADPPSFAPSAAAKEAAMESYAALHNSALRLVEEGGLYLAASCSSHITREDFDATLREGARRARRVHRCWNVPGPRPITRACLAFRKATT